MKLSTCFLVGILTAFHGMGQAEQMPKETFRQMMLNLGVVNYWEKAPLSLVMYCARAYPDVGPRLLSAQSKWMADNIEINTRVGAASKKYSPFVAKYIGKTLDQYQLMATRVTDEEVAKAMNSIDATQRHQSCADFPRLLEAMLSPTDAKPRVNAAIEDLLQYDKFLAK